MKEKISVIFSVLDSLDELRDSIESSDFDKVHQVIVVDGYSSDGTLDYLKSLDLEKLSILQRKPIGLGDARHAGALKANGNIILHCGPDNIVSEEMIYESISKLDTYDLVSFKTKLINRNYVSKFAQLKFDRLNSGVMNQTVGTPYACDIDVFLKYFDPDTKYNDDTIFCHNLLQNNKSIYRSPLINYSTDNMNFREFFARQMQYGQSDWMTYQHNKHTPNINLRSTVTHPFETEFIVLFELNLVNYIRFVPMIILSIIFRYVGIIKSIIS